ncbi:MAG: biopolymer transporter ExbD [Deltaproteobacteria bacterium]|nr:biopolymer transporter ExbD [Deltaproteobacteria bacterium]MBN2687108.1 biopolymer transporter ExbD [Deltaproteobacteria bacterium]
MKVSRRYSTKARIEMIPLIDVIFLLLVTFIFFTMSMTIHRGLPVQLPSASTAMVETKGFVEITIRQDGKIFMDKRNVTLKDLQSLLTSLHRKSPGTKVLISGDRKASYDIIISVMDAVKQSGISGVSLETTWKK